MRRLEEATRLSILSFAKNDPRSVPQLGRPVCEPTGIWCWVLENRRPRHPSAVRNEEQCQDGSGERATFAD
jgi:hypothetical protein